MEISMVQTRSASQLRVGQDVPVEMWSEKGRARGREVTMQHGKAEGVERASCMVRAADASTGESALLLSVALLVANLAADKVD
jgi:hypothetical protein